jgi:hypothetical protein
MKRKRMRSDDELARRIREITDYLKKRLEDIEKEKKDDEEYYAALGRRRGIAAALLQIVIPELRDIQKELEK